MHYYRNVDDIFTFYLRGADIALGGEDHHVGHPLRLIAFDGRVPGAASAARLRRPGGGGGGSGVGGGDHGATV